MALRLETRRRLRQRLAREASGPWLPLAACAISGAPVAARIGPSSVQLAYSLRAWRIWTGSGSFPFAESLQHGPGEILAAVPFVAAFGPTSRAVGVESAAIVAAVMIGAWGLAQALSGDRWRGVAAGLLLALCPGLLEAAFGRGGSGLLAYLALAFSLWAAWLWVSWMDRPRPWKLVCAGLLLGASLSSHSTQLPVVPALAAAAWIGRRRARRALAACPPAALAAAALGAALPVIFLGLSTLGSSAFMAEWWLTHLAQNVAGGSYAAKLCLSARQLFALLTATAMLSGPLARLGPWLAGAAAGAAWLPSARLGEPWRRTLSTGFLLFHLALAPLSPTEVREYHEIPAAAYFWIDAAAAAPLAPLAAVAAGQAVLSAAWARSAARALEKGGRLWCTWPRALEPWAASQSWRGRVVTLSYLEKPLLFYSGGLASVVPIDAGNDSPQDRQGARALLRAGTTVLYDPIDLQEPHWIEAQAAAADRRLAACPGLDDADGHPMVRCLTTR